MRCPAAPPADVRAALGRTVVWPSRALLAGAVLLAPWAADLPPWALYAPFVASLALFGLPHGAVDHLALLRLARAPVRAGPLLVVVAGYLAVSATVVAAWALAPAAAFVGFIALTWVHWGQGDVHAVVGLGAAGHLPTRGARLATAAVRGGLPMLVPLLAAPDAYRSVAGAVVGRVAPEATAALGWAFGDGVRLAAGLAFAGLALATLAAGLRRPGTRRDALADAADTALLAAFFWTVPPVLAVGLYFCAWHAPRHIARLLALDPAAAADLAAGRSARAWGRFAAAAVPLTLGALALGGVGYALAPVAPTRLDEHVGLYLILISALTLPHTLVVAWMDRAQGVWSPAAAGAPATAPGRRTSPWSTAAPGAPRAGAPARGTR